jgi:epoxyqueuosine reductase QueG
VRGNELKMRCDFTKEIKSKAYEMGFGDVGIASVDQLRNSPHGWVADVKELKYPWELLPNARSVIMLVLHAWDKAFFMQIESPHWKGYGIHKPEENVEGHYITYKISEAKAGPLVQILKDKGYEAMITTSIPMKSTALSCGLGSRGKNTLMIHPVFGPRIGLMAIVTDAKLEPDAALIKDQCGDCERCVRACPTRALSSNGVDINRCIAYASENPSGKSVPPDVRAKVDEYTVRPSKCSYLECTICMDACPIGRDIENILRLNRNAPVRD